MARVFNFALWAALLAALGTTAAADTTQEVVNKAPNGLPYCPR